MTTAQKKGDRVVNGDSGDYNNSYNRTLGTVGGILALFALIGGVTAIVRPMEQEIAAVRNECFQQKDGLQSEIGRLRQWQDDYSKGTIPSSAEPKMAAMEQKFVEVETQFHAFKDRMLENESHTTLATDRLTRELETASERAVRNSERLVAVETALRASKLAGTER